MVVSSSTERPPAINEEETTSSSSSSHVRNNSEPLDFSNPRTLAFLERQWSVPGGIAASSTPGPFLQAQESPFHQSWATGSSDFLGASFSDSFAGSFGASHASLGSRATSAASSSTAQVSAEDAAQQNGLGDDNNMLSSVIHDEARITNWDTVLSLCKSHPQYAEYAGPDGWTALHHACNRRCPRADAVEALIEAYPDALLDLEDKGMTPLHYACRFKAPKEAVRHLLYLYPRKGKAAVSRRDKKGRTPLFYAVRYDAPPGVVEMLLEVDPDAVLDEDKNADGPMAHVWTSYAEKFEGRHHLQPFLSGEFTPQQLQVKLQENSKLRQRWKVVEKLLRGAYRFPQNASDQKDWICVDSCRPWRMLHATAAIKCHPTLFLMAKAFFPEQASQLDNGDLYALSEPSKRTALHFAASSPAVGDLARTVIGSLLDLFPEAAAMADELDGSLPLHNIVENERKVHWRMDGVDLVYRANPAATSVPDQQKRFPLHRAAAQSAHQTTLDEESTGFETRSVIYNLVEAYPEAAAAPDVSGRLPLHYVAENGKEWSREAEYILAAHEAAARVRAGPDAQSRLPLHLAAANPNAKKSLIEKLVELHPRAASQPDAAGKLPLHLASEAGMQWEEGAKAIYDAYPDAVREVEANDRGWTALQMACASEKECGSLIEALVELNPDATCRKDSRGRFALHWACVSGTAWKMGLRDIFDANPDAVMTEDNDGCLPFHAAAFHFKSQEEESDKEEKVEFRNRSTFRSTAEVATRRNESLRSASNTEILFEMLRAQPSILLK